MVGLALLPVAVVPLREVQHAREVPFAVLPLILAAHQLVETLVWAGFDAAVSPGVQQAAARVYLIVALPVLPVLMPVAVLMLEPRSRRLRVASFVVLGSVVAACLAEAVRDGPIRVLEHPHALSYVAHIDDVVVWTGLYILAVIGPSLLSGYRSLVAFGVVNLGGLGLVALVYADAFASLWCLWAAARSVLVAVHMWRRRHRPDADRVPARRPAPTTVGYAGPMEPRRKPCPTVVPVEQPESSACWGRRAPAVR